MRVGEHHRRAELLHLRQEQRERLHHAELDQTSQRGLAHRAVVAQEPTPELPQQRVRVRVETLGRVHEPVVDELAEHGKRRGGFVAAADGRERRGTGGAASLSASRLLGVPEQSAALEIVEQVRVGDGAHRKVVRLELDAHRAIRAGRAHLRARVGTQRRGIEIRPAALRRAAAEIGRAAGARPQELRVIAERAREKRVGDVQTPVLAEVPQRDVRVAADGDALREPFRVRGDARERGLRGGDLPPERGHAPRIRGVGGDGDDGKPFKRGHQSGHLPRRAFARGHTGAVRVVRVVLGVLEEFAVAAERNRSGGPGVLQAAHGGTVVALEVRRQKARHDGAGFGVRLGVLHAPLARRASRLAVADFSARFGFVFGFGFGAVRVTVRVWVPERVVVVDGHGHRRAPRLLRISLAGERLAGDGAPEKRRRRAGAHLGGGAPEPAVGGERAGRHKHQQRGVHGGRVQHEDALVPRAGAVQRHVAQRAGRRLRERRVRVSETCLGTRLRERRQRQVPKLGDRARLEVARVVLADVRARVDPVFVSRLLPRLFVHERDASEFLDRRLHERDVPLEDAEHVGVGEQVRRLETGDEIALVHRHLVHVRGARAARERRHDAPLPPRAEVALAVRRARRHRQDAAHAEGHAVHGPLRQDPGGERAGLDGTVRVRLGLERDHLPRAPRQNLLAALREGAQAARAEHARARRAAGAGRRAGRASERLGVLGALALALLLQHVPLRLLERKPRAVVLLPVRLGTERVQPPLRQGHRVRRARLRARVGGRRARAGRASAGARQPGARLRRGRRRAVRRARGSVLGFVREEAAHARPPCLPRRAADETPAVRVLHVVEGAGDARRLAGRDGAVAEGVRVGVRLRQRVLGEEVLELLLLEGVVLVADHLVQPVGVRDARTRVGDVLQRRRDGDDLLHRAAQPRRVVVPVHERPHVRRLVRVARGDLLGPLFQEGASHRGLRLEDGHRDGARRRGRARGLGRDDVLRLQTFVLHHVAADERAEAFGARRGAALAVAVLLERLGHGGRLGDVLDEVLIREVASLRLEHVQPLVGDGAHRGVHALQRVPLQELLEHLRLEHLDELELAAALHLEALELLERPVEVEDGVSFLDELALLLGRGQDHRLVRPVHLKLDAHLALGDVPAVRVFALHLVLVVRAHHRGEPVQNRARVGNLEALLEPRIGARRQRKLLGEGSGQTTPDAVRVQLERLTDVVH